ncbi:MAG: WecB/TagA/CpsF family glycosyltransferase [Sulfurimonas sp.]|nr:WecB/TagA/CpsF family glycosyltransferase [Sulfurimonas sp.]
MKNKIVRNYKIYAFESKQDFLNQIKNEKKILIAMNAEKILKDDAHLQDIVNKNIGYSDGVGAVIALKKNGLNTIKIPGAEFWLDIVKEFEKEKSFYFVGSSLDVMEKTVLKLQKEFLHVKIVGYRDGYLKENDKEKLIEDLHAKKPDVIFIAQGSPRQEYLMEELIKVYPALYMGLGGSFDVYSGLKKRAPSFFIDLHIEWLYRLIKEPMRIGRQLTLVKFMVLLKLGKL